jgi:hypothetical protein
MARSATRKRPCVYLGCFLVFVGVSHSKCREPSETAALARLLHDKIEADHYPLSPRVQMTKGILAEISPEPLKASLAPNGLDRNPSRCRQRNITSRREQGEFGDGEEQLFPACR